MFFVLYNYRRGLNHDLCIRVESNSLEDASQTTFLNVHIQDTTESLLARIVEGALPIGIYPLGILL